MVDFPRNLLCICTMIVSYHCHNCDVDLFLGRVSSISWCNYQISEPSGNLLLPHFTLIFRVVSAEVLIQVCFYSTEIFFHSRFKALFDLCERLFMIVLFSLIFVVLNKLIVYADVAFPVIIVMKLFLTALFFIPMVCMNILTTLWIHMINNVMKESLKTFESLLLAWAKFKVAYEPGIAAELALIFAIV